MTALYEHFGVQSFIILLQLRLYFDERFYEIYEKSTSYARHKVARALNCISWTTFYVTRGT